MRVILHGFGSFPILFYHVIEYAKRRYPEVEWAIILSSPHHEALMVSLLGRDNVFVLNANDGSCSAEEKDWLYPGSLHRDIDSEKRNFKFARSHIQLQRAMNLYRGARRFMARFNPSHALVSQVEGLDGKVFLACAKQMGIPVVVPTHCRNLGGIFFSPDDCESLPPYANAADSAARQAAASFLREFRQAPKAPAVGQGLAEDRILSGFQKPFLQRVGAALQRRFDASEAFEWDYLRAAFLNNLPWLRDAIWNLRRWKNQRLCDITGLEQLPDKFVFYPLQYSPESSINTPAPYFVDQMRAIDAIRHALPSDVVLLIKEHPACILLRSGSFVRELLHKSGVVVAHYALPSAEIVKRAHITISVTGTATFEAYMLGRPSVTLGNAFFSEALGGVCKLHDLRAKIAQQLDSKIDDADIIDFLARVFSVRKQIVFGSPGMAGEPVLRERNVAAFAEGFMQHCRAIDGAKE
ncbi:capsular polysaccharide export protein, LipB/KpsS family [Methylomonas koyamae]|uniref:capsular polysaccharide export protein, LipB/KpsS family n=1 Tax=Methylomonas koyamae TaxID=702114 RepID=UPI000A43D661|nr:hypothetical protein [Methylomonas koyamae]BBL57693.1 hypothetical protein MKFW12EY_13060 [Methylomonas koyamae]